MRRIYRLMVLGAVCALVMLVWDAEADETGCDQSALRGYWHLVVMLPEHQREGITTWSLHLPIDEAGQVYSDGDTAPDMAWIAAGAGPVADPAHCAELRADGTACLDGDMIDARGGGELLVSPNCVVSGGIIEHPDGGWWYEWRGVMHWLWQDAMTLVITRHALGAEPTVVGVGQATQHVVGVHPAPVVEQWHPLVFSDTGAPRYVWHWGVTGEEVGTPGWSDDALNCDGVKCRLTPDWAQPDIHSVCSVMADGRRRRCTVRPY